jgi:hypothetical protein
MRAVVSRKSFIKSLGEPIVQPTGHAHGIVTAVIDEDHPATLRLTL